MLCAPVVSLCTNGISWGIAMLTQAFGWVGGKSQKDRKWDCFSSCSSCWTNGWRGGVAEAIHGSQDALTWPCSWQWESSLTSFLPRASSQQQNHSLCQPADLAPHRDDGKAERSQKRRGLATCQPKEGHVGQEAKNIMTDKQVLCVLPSNEHPKNSHTHAQACPALAVLSGCHCRWIPTQKIPAQLGSWRNSL